MTKRIFFSLLRPGAAERGRPGGCRHGHDRRRGSAGCRIQRPDAGRSVGGNPGTTVGEQRLVSFQFAADVWGTALDSAVEIRSGIVPGACAGDDGHARPRFSSC